MPFSHSQHTMRPPRFLPLSAARQNFPPPSFCRLLHPPPPTACFLPFLLPVSPRAPSSAYPAKSPCKQHLPPQNPHRFHDAARLRRPASLSFHYPSYFPHRPLFPLPTRCRPMHPPLCFPTAHCIFHAASCRLPYPFRPSPPIPHPVHSLLKDALWAWTPKVSSNSLPLPRAALCKRLLPSSFPLVFSLRKENSPARAPLLTLREAGRIGFARAIRIRIRI